MTYSGEGLGQMSRNFHDVMRNNLIRGKWKNMRRPILIEMILRNLKLLRIKLMVWLLLMAMVSHDIDKLTLEDALDRLIRNFVSRMDEERMTQVEDSPLQ